MTFYSYYCQPTSISTLGLQNNNAMCFRSGVFQAPSTYQASGGLACPVSGFASLGLSGSYGGGSSSFSLDHGEAYQLLETNEITMQNLNNCQYEKPV